MPKRFDRSVPVEEQVVFAPGLSYQVAAGATEFHHPAGNMSTLASEAAANSRLPVARRAKGLVVRTSSAQPGTGALTVTMRKNGADAALTVAVPAGAAAGVFRDDSNGVDLDTPDDFCFKLVNAAPAALSAQVEQIAYLLG